MEHSLDRERTAPAALDRRLCQVGGINHNYMSRSGTLYHIQIEDRGPVTDRLSDREVRRVNLIVYANYGEPNARIVHGRDHDYPDIRSQAHNQFIEQEVQQLAAEARTIIEEREKRNIERIKGQIRQYYLTKSEATKKEFEQTNALYPFLFSRAWLELKQERAASGEAPPSAPGHTEGSPEEVVYPLDTDLRERVLDIERIIMGLAQDLRRLRARDRADDVLLLTCSKLVMEARQLLSGREKSEFTTKRLELTRDNLLATWRQVRSLLKS